MQRGRRVDPNRVCGRIRILKRLAKSFNELLSLIAVIFFVRNTILGVMAFK